MRHAYLEDSVRLGGKMGKIFCLMGKSASGKDTIYKMLLSDKQHSFKKIVPYTTRPIRENERDGVQYFFTNEEGLHKMQEEGKVIELRSYNTIHGVWHYFTADDHQINLESGDYMVIGTPEAYIKLKEYFGDNNVCPIYIELDDGIRLERALNRERAQEQPKYEEMCRRFLADARDFSEDNLAKAGISKRFANDNLDNCVEEIMKFISEN